VIFEQRNTHPGDIAAGRRERRRKGLIVKLEQRLAHVLHVRDELHSRFIQMHLGREHLWAELRWNKPFRADGHEDCGTSTIQHLAERIEEPLVDLPGIEGRTGSQKRGSRSEFRLFVRDPGL